MGPCASQRIPQTTKDVASLCKQEIDILKLIYDDLSCRIADCALNLQNFLLFFHKNGLWGERLFREFDFDKSQLINFGEFIKGIAKIFKTSQEAKISLLFSFFSNKNENNKEGVSFKQFLRMLYNYPKKELKLILNDEQFFVEELKKHLVKGNKRVDSTVIFNNPKVVYELDKESQGSMFGKDIIMNMKLQQDDSVVKIKYKDRDIEVKTSSIHNLVKKFARNIFKTYNIDIDNGKLSEDIFQKWVRKHKNLYDNYYEGFHNEIWELDPQNNKLKLFLSKNYQKKERAKLVTTTNDFQNVLVLCNGQKPIQVICLEGLKIQPASHQAYGEGVQISHRDGIYKKRYLYFEKKEVAAYWMEYLEDYKGETVLQLYDMHQRIGTGKFSVVFQATQRATKKNVAIKMIESYKLDIDSRQLLAHQSTVMSLLSNPFLLHYERTIKSKTHIYIITELVKGKDLFEFVRENRYLSQPQSALIAYQLIIGVRYLHSLGIVHRDLKPQNVMVSLNQSDEQITSIKVIDFGFANYLQTLKQMPPSDVVVGTPNYIAPEMLNMEPITQKIDNFSIGSIVLSGQPPFNGYDIDEIFKRTRDGYYTYQGRRWQNVSQQAKNFIDGLLKLNPAQRMSLDEAGKHPWLVKNAQKAIIQQAQNTHNHKKNEHKEVMHTQLF